MTVCFTFGGKTYCFHIPVIFYPIHPPKPDPELKDYAELFSDATILASVREAAKSISNAAVREAVHGGMNSALKALQHQAGGHVSASFAE